MVNKVILVGNVGKDPEIRTVGDGKKVSSFSLATSEKYNGETKTEWHNITVWGKLADVVESYVKKGSKLYLEGKINTRKHEEKYYTSIVCFSLQMLDSRGDNSPNANTEIPPAPTNGAPETDDLPF